MKVPEAAAMEVLMEIDPFGGSRLLRSYYREARRTNQM
jgi:hypothetical protein